MAVQAQYPSNFLLLNNRNVQEGHEYSTDAGGFADQTHILLNNGVYANWHKRGREGEGGFNPTIVSSSSPANVLSLQSTPPQRTAAVFDQREEMEQFLHIQGELLRRTLAERRQSHYRALLDIAEATLSRKLREKDAEAEKERSRHAELQARAAQLSAEAHIWQSRARAQESTAASLREHLQQVRIRDGPDDAESMYIDPARDEPTCKACRKRAATVLLLPCRHLSLCTECDSGTRNCPICFCAKSSSMEIFLS